MRRRRNRAIDPFCHAAVELTTVFGATEVALRGGDESIRSNLPDLEATDANPVSGPSRPGVGADQRPVILNAVLEAIRVPPPPVVGCNWNATTSKTPVIH